MHVYVLCALVRGCRKLGSCLCEGWMWQSAACRAVCSIVGALGGCWWGPDNLDALACFCVTLRALLCWLRRREARNHEPPVQLGGFVAEDETAVGMRMLQKEAFCRTA